MEPGMRQTSTNLLLVPGEFMYIPLPARGPTKPRNSKPPPSQQTSLTRRVAGLYAGWLFVQKAYPTRAHTQETTHNDTTFVSPACELLSLFGGNLNWR